MVTSIQLNENVKNALDRMKQKSNETYEDVIVNMMKTLEMQRRKQIDLMIEGCKVMAEDSLRITKEWESTDATLDWEWNEN
ncbi:MAG: hypothetical protein AABW80_00070 [Nanoarchaeota archaeon]